MRHQINREDKPLKFIIPFLMAALPAASVAQPQSGGGSGVPGIAIPKTTEVIVIETPRQGVTPDHIMAVIPAEIRATVKLYLDGRIRQWYRAATAKAWSSWSTRRPRTRHGNAAAREGTLDGSPVHSGRTLDAAEGVDRTRCAAVSFVQPGRRFK